MIDKELIAKWVNEQIINQQQAQRMIYDIEQKKSEKRSNRFIQTISIIGASLLGIAAILFVAANWASIGIYGKMLLAFSVTFISYAAGYLLQFGSVKLPKVGIALIFLACILFGASIFQIAQAYNVIANASGLVFIWFCGVFPLVYLHRSQILVVLSAVIGYIWLALVLEVDIFSWVQNVSIFLLGGLLTFALGGLHYLIKDYQKIARMYRLVGLQIAYICLFIFTFPSFIEARENFVKYTRFGTVFTGSAVGILIVVTFLAQIANILLRSQKNRTLFYEYLSSSFITGAVGIFLYGTTGSEAAFIPLFNIAFLVITIFMIYLGYQKEEMKVVNMGIFWLAAFVLAKYFTFFWQLMERSLFFFLGGIVLVGGGILLENQRRRLKKSFKKDTPEVVNTVQNEKI